MIQNQTYSTVFVKIARLKRRARIGLICFEALNFQHFFA